MKFNIEVELDYIYENSIDEIIINKIANEVTKKITKNIEAQVTEQVSQKINEILDLKIMELFDEFLNKGFTLYDRWGDVVRENVNVKQLLKEKLDKFMTEYVDEKGNTTNSYNGRPRYEQILNNEAKKQINGFLDELSRTVIKGIKEDINQAAVERISKAILNDYELGKLVNPLR